MPGASVAWAWVLQRHEAPAGSQWDGWWILEDEHYICCERTARREPLSSHSFPYYLLSESLEHGDASIIPSCVSSILRMFRMGTIRCDTCMCMFTRTWTKPLVVVDVNNVLAAPHPRRLPSPGSPLEFPPQTLTCSATYLPHSTFEAAITTCAPLDSFLQHSYPSQYHHYGF
jgi:hypothetical protein